MAFALLVLLLPGVGGGPLDVTAKAVAGQIVEQPRDVARLYHATFLNALSEDKLINLYQDFHAKYGPVVSVSPLERDSEFKGQFSYLFEKNVHMKVTLVITPNEPHRVIGVWFGPPVESYKHIADIVKDLNKLPGKVSFQLARLGDGVEVLHAVNPDLPLAIGSTFKLYILGGLVRDHKPWDEVLLIEERYKSLPSGALHNWPGGSPITVHTLAAGMISVSDNTATDHLLHHVGRQRVESLLKEMGNTHADKTTPFLTTFEMFKLKGDEALLRRYLQADLAGRRTMLSDDMPGIPRKQVSPYPEGMPVAIEQVEWFASAADLCRLMDWFRERNDHTALDIMAINPGLDVPEERFDYAGYKGGSEPGVLNMTWLLKTAEGTYYALSVGWNNPTAEGADLMKMIGMIQPMIDLLGKGQVE